MCPGFCEMKLVKFSFFDQLGECPIQVDIEKDDALFEEVGLFIPHLVLRGDF